MVAGRVISVMIAAVVLGAHPLTVKVSTCTKSGITNIGNEEYAMRVYTINGIYETLGQQQPGPATHA